MLAFIVVAQIDNPLGKLFIVLPIDNPLNFMWNLCLASHDLMIFIISLSLV